MNVRPTKGVIVLKAPNKEDGMVTSGGIHLPQNAKLPNTDKVGVVYAIGADVKVEYLEVGDRVVVDPRNLVVAVIDDEIHIFAKDENIVAILKKDFDKDEETELTDEVKSFVGNSESWKLSHHPNSHTNKETG